ncbi:2,3-bisphosphoglycerate-independent phosphoglycerate mutase [Methanococcus aeolicus]|uniref:2,3-bisphosphoglycerate-independent phosphoglycerate mutase n=1 Tax=Methanococcus aeolicus (strain ATCC BAA-1280 / DSM 17508 / OCM 812 / Nankai-3) TaxID=419665 RepID=APGM_META3|nr:2,3-bisphosphoglycerate-independent phosphoglycerate mutase [Methanococcus aeolicus]A6UTF2.1 RecName: Full=2,3-bisphosphoglycerate-independent phosphoglycerate mutase; Short=BPG-independent PGAM; Short=Phosphoglyceromutase; Short=aPGAM [Methanococcus aeolicus Nankai-3]ABR55774.1 phosphonopyruvate decarboxylase-related protein [Methanococcus aeolicus Nankai-3]UXM84120.1 2,3-bisphosphoglycerate-independent phosphoglycerate mutase [Methanococcus aeolicus]
MKAVVFIIDGLGDRPNKQGNTPLKEAHTPTMDKMAKEGICGIMNAVDIGVGPGSDTAHLALLGYNPYTTYTGRGPFEACGVGIDVKAGDIAFRCNFATVDDNLTIIDRRAGRIKNTEELEKAIDGLKVDGVEVIFKQSGGYRAALVLRGPNLSDKITEGDPHKEGVPIPEVKPLDNSEDAKRTATILNKVIKIAHDKLNSHPVNEERRKNGELPANAILPRGVGMVPNIQPFNEKNDIKGACIAGTGLIKGIAKMVQLDYIDVEGATGTPTTNLKNKADALLNAIKTYDFVLINVKGADEASHDGNYELKKEFIEKIDKMLKYILENIDKNEVYITLTGDHSTPIEKKDHSADPIPIVIWGKSVRVDAVETFDEFSTYKGGLCWIKGENIVPILLDLTGKAHKYGA